MLGVSISGSGGSMKISALYFQARKSFFSLLCLIFILSLLRFSSGVSLFSTLYTMLYTTTVLALMPSASALPQGSSLFFAVNESRRRGFLRREFNPWSYEDSALSFIPKKSCFPPDIKIAQTQCPIQKKTEKLSKASERSR